MYKSLCANSECDKGEDGLRKIIYAYAKSKTGELQKVYCCKQCEGDTSYRKRFVDER